MVNPIKIEMANDNRWIRRRYVMRGIQTKRRPGSKDGFCRGPRLANRP